MSESPEARYANVSFVPGAALRPQNHTWYLARARVGADPLGGDDFPASVPAPWKAVRVGPGRFVFFQGMLQMDRTGRESVDTLLMGEQAQMEVGPEMPEKDVLPFLREAGKRQPVAQPPAA